MPTITDDEAAHYRFLQAFAERALELNPDFARRVEAEVNNEELRQRVAELEEQAAKRPPPGRQRRTADAAERAKAHDEGDTDGASTTT